LEVDVLHHADRERGEGRLGFIVAMLVAAIVIFCGMKLIPVKVKLFNFSDRVEQKLERASWRNYEQAHEEIIKFVRQEALSTGLDTKNLKVSMPAPVTGEMVVVVDWEIPVDLQVTRYDWKYHLEKRAPMLGRGGNSF